LFLLGVNYWPASIALDMWTDWRPEELVDDIGRMKSLGLNCCRFFLIMPAFMPRPDRVEPLILERLHAFLRECEREHFYTLLTFIVGHMSGEDWDVPWRRGANFIKDKRVMAATQRYLEAIVQAVKNYEYIAGWVLTNELPNYVGQQSAEDIARWVKAMYETIKAIDPRRPVCIGDGGWAPEISAEQTGFELRKLNHYQDYVGLHYYPRGLNAWRHAFTTAFRLRMAHEWGKPVLVEEFGTSTTLCSEENQARYLRSVLFSALINGAEGALSWCLNDFDFDEKRPYTHHLFEEQFGIVRIDKSLKPAAHEFARFRAVVEDLWSKGYQKVELPVGLFIPSNYYYRYPYQFQPEFNQWYDFYLEVFALLKRANLEVKMIVEPAQELEAGGDYTHALQLSPQEVPILFMPRLKVMTKRTWRALWKYVEDGGCVYCSFANDSWVLDWHKLAGIEMDCKFGVPDFRRTTSLGVKVLGDFGVFRAGENWQMPLLRNDSECSYCAIRSVSGRIIMLDQYNMPFLLENRIGRGRVVFTPYPLEILAMMTNTDEFEAHLVRLYRSIGLEYMSPNPIAVVGDGLEYGVWRQDDSYRLIIFNHAWQDLQGGIRLSDQSLFIRSSSVELTQKQGVYHFNIPAKNICQVDWHR